jgi:hypothetical protein
MAMNRTLGFSAATGLGQPIRVTRRNVNLARIREGFTSADVSGEYPSVERAFPRIVITP